MTSPGRHSSAGRVAMTKHVVRLPIGGRPFLDIFSGGRAGPRVPGGFTRGQIEQIWRTVRRTPEVMVK